METLLNQKITSMSVTGHGIIEGENLTPIYVLGAFPGDIIDVQVYKKLPQLWYGEILKFHTYSELRENFPDQSPFFLANTPWESLSLSGEYALKQDIIEKIYPEHIHILRKIDINPDIPHTQYRNKVAYAFETDNNGKLVFALYDRGTSQSGTKKQGENILVHPRLEKAAHFFLHFLNQHRVQKKDIKYLILRYSYFSDSVVAQVLFPETNRKKLPLKKSDYEKMQAQHKSIQGILVSHSEAGIRSAITTKDFYSVGNIESIEKVLDKKYYYHPSLFFQIYPKAFEHILIDIRKELIKIEGIKKLHLLDLFAGVGIIGIELADLVDSVTGVELSSLSKDYALKNREVNNIQNFNFIQASSDDVLDYIQTDQILVVDPTRSGLSKNLCNKINEIQPKYIVYVSCNPESQAQDIHAIKEFYEIIFIKAYNIFPKTHHIESLVILKKLL